MKVLFLDIDGVIAPANDPSKRTEVREGLILPYIWRRELCEELNRIIKETGCEIVISSDWRRSHSLQELREIFIFHGIEGTIIGYTPTSKEYKFGSLGFGRSLEISEWLRLHKPENWCALDDLNLSAIDAAKFVKTRPDIGLVEEIADKVIKILNNDNKERS